MRKLATFKSIGRYGRLANQMYQIAGLIGIARRNNMDFALTEPWRNHDGRNFEPDLDIDVFTRFVNPLPIYSGPELPQRGIPWGYQDVVLNDSADLLGHLQSEKYFSHAIDEIRWYMRMIGELPANDYCAIHYRAGDYGSQKSAQHPDGNSYHPRMGLNYYEPAMALFPSRQKFLVFSDDLEGAREMFGDKVEYSEGGDYFEDFRRLKTCAHFIIANSSYSAFAAVLGDANDKQVVAPDPWFGGPYTGRISAEDIYSSDWTVINWEHGTMRKAA